MLLAYRLLCDVKIPDFSPLLKAFYTYNSSNRNVKFPFLSLFRPPRPPPIRPESIRTIIRAQCVNILWFEWLFDFNEWKSRSLLASWLLRQRDQRIITHWAKSSWLASPRFPFFLALSYILDCKLPAINILYCLSLPPTSLDASAFWYSLVTRALSQLSRKQKKQASSQQLSTANKRKQTRNDPYP